MGLYNLDYFELMLRQNAGTAELINKIRWKFILDYILKDDAFESDGFIRVLDYGSGIGFFRDWRPEGVEVDTFDIADYPQTGKWHEKYDIVCFFDVLEHLPNFSVVFDYLQTAKYVVLSIPILPEGVELTTWKHYKPGEHLHYFSEETLKTFLKTYDFQLVKKGQPECPPRQDVWDFLFKKQTKKDNLATGTKSRRHSDIHKCSKRPKRNIS
jgi:hypothetical protein